ncbi:cbb3-type cytochrome c oxidase subunit I [Desulfurispirillum indicum]|uniref:Cytochrome c oxidase subunit I n=1 Tax=Desulfurispirillum indicum (strain ATCC BAA-1389 / DSM 22839 / S5) TaxID=653733 RepID=E6W3A7_DESIS|nr:cbb3-type cytochrome c oxidase subunit I [Desulfurispirillum indicum]ADU66861.1 cytochrome c oxidase subunit I [Desulfurispirillum indicum S5]UCZ56179.1 cbb3-type cytochrome c oxidase subunit I [Desulfurispirillum indicum]
MDKPAYNYDIVRSYTHWSILWGVVAILVGILISFQFVLPQLNFAPYFTYGRLRPIHTNGALLGWTLCAIFALYFYMVQRLCRVPIWSEKLARIQLWLFNSIIILGVVTLLLGFNSTKEYHELEWPLDILVVVMWVMFAVNIFMTIFKRKEEQMYVSLWFMMASIVAIAILYIVNGLAVPASLFKSYSVFAGTNDANVQWWYGHNMVAMLLTAPPLAVFYYFLPKSTGVPIYSHRLSIIAFWSLIFMYLWTGAHHLLWTPVPDWVQTLAIAFSIMLIAPSWASVINGYLSMNGQWQQMRTNYLVKFFILGITFYGLQTLQGPMQAIRSFSGFIHYTEWVPGHVHMGALGWVSLVMFGAIYYLAPKLYGRELYSIPLANAHFWLVLVGQLIYSVSLWIAGLQQASMWHSINADGSLTYTFSETVAAMYPYWWVRAVSGVIYLAGVILFVYNLVMTARGPRETVHATNLAGKEA